jgi:hypothetical protein
MNDATRLAVLLACTILLACGALEPETPEGQVRARLAEMEQAAEAGDVGEFKELISERYQDALGHDKQRLSSYVTFHVLRNQRGRQVILRLRDVEVIDPTRAAVVAHIGLAGSGASSTLRGSVYLLELDLEREADETWRITWAQWKPAGAAELL